MFYSLNIKALHYVHFSYQRKERKKEKNNMYCILEWQNLSPDSFDTFVHPDISQKKRKNNWYAYSTDYYGKFQIIY